MTNTHRKTTNRTTAKIAAVGAFGIGAAIAFPGLAAAQEAPEPESPTASLENLAGENGSVEGALGTDIALDMGSLSFNLNLDAETPNPGSVEFGSLGVSPNTGSGLIDGDSGSGSAEEEPTEEAGSLDTGSLPGSSDEDATEETGTGSAGSSDDDATTDETEETGSLDVGSLAGLSSGAEDDTDNGDTTGDTTETAATGSLG